MARKKQAAAASATATDSAGPIDLPQSTTAPARVAAAPQEWSSENSKPTAAPAAVAPTASAKPVEEPQKAESSDDNGPADGRKYDIPEGLTKSQKKNLRKSLRNKERKAEDRGMQQLLEDPLQEERQTAYEEIKKELDALPPLSRMAFADVNANYMAQEATLSRLISAIEDAKMNFCIKIKKPDNRRVSSAKLLEQIKELQARPEKDQVAVQFLEEQLSLVVSWENARKFMQTLAELRTKIEERQELNLKQEKAIHLVKRVREVKQLQNDKSGAEPLSITAAHIVSQEVALSAEALTVLFPPGNISRRVERCYGVLLDKPGRASRVCTVTGLEADVKEALKFLVEADFAGNSKVILDPKAMPGFVGKGGVGIRDLEAKLKCFFNTKDSTVFVYGTKEKTHEAIEHIKEMKTQRPQETVQISRDVPIDHAAVARAMTGKFLKIVKALEAKHGVHIRMNIAAPSGAFGADLTASSAPVPKAVDNSRSSATVRGRVPSAVEEAAAEVTKECSTLRAVELEPATPKALDKLFSRVGAGVVPAAGTSSSPSGRTGTQQSVGARFNLLQAVADDVAFMKHEGKLAMVGTPAALEAVYEQVKQLLAIASFTSTNVRVSNDLIFLFSTDRMTLIEHDTGASLRKGKSADDHTTLEILGTEEQKAAALAEVNHILETEANVQEVILADQDTINTLTREGRKKLRDIEDTCACRIIIDRTNKTCRVIGSSSNVAAAALMLKEEDDKHVERAALWTTREVAIPSGDIIGRIIGHKGATIQSVRESSKVDQIDIDDAKLVVRLRGPPENCDVAERLIKDIIGRHSRTPVAAAPPAQTAPTKSPSRPQPSVHAAPLGSSGPRWGEAVEFEPAALTPSRIGRAGGGWNSTPIAQQGLQLDPAEGGMFPTLGEAIGQGKQQKRVNRRRIKKEVEDDGQETPVEMTTICDPSDQ